MFDELSKYKQTKHFFFKVTDKLNKVCNAPTDKSLPLLVRLYFLRFSLRRRLVFNQRRTIIPIACVHRT